MSVTNGVAGNANAGLPDFAVSHGLTSLTGCNGTLPAAVVERRAASRVAQDTASVALAGRLISRASRGSDVRFGLVASLRERIETGTYKVSAAEIADKLLHSMGA